MNLWMRLTATPSKVLICIFVCIVYVSANMFTHTLANVCRCRTNEIYNTSDVHTHTQKTRYTGRLSLNMIILREMKKKQNLAHTLTYIILNLIRTLYTVLHCITVHTNIIFSKHIEYIQTERSVLFWPHRCCCYDCRSDSFWYSSYFKMVDVWFGYLIFFWKCFDSNLFKTTSFWFFYLVKQNLNY